jgi:hypothetical protein
MFTDKLIKIKEELNKDKNIDREQYYRQCITDRLDKSLNAYYEELSKSVNLISNTDAKKVIRKL